MSRLLDLFLPGPQVALAAGGAGLAAGLASAAISAWTRRVLGMRTADTRKLFHFLIFSGALVVQVIWETPGTAAYGSVVAALVFLAVLRGEGDPFFEALARPTDRPRRGLFVVVPLLSTAVGGVTSNLVAGEFAAVGYLVAGWGDAVAEPVGVRWGRHRYRVPSLAGVPAERSLEGSASVLVVGSVAAWAAVVLLGYGGWAAVLVAAACGVAATAVEAVSHHGLDNFTLQVAASLVAALLLGG